MFWGKWYFCPVRLFRFWRVLSSRGKVCSHVCTLFSLLSARITTRQWYFWRVIQEFCSLTFDAICLKFLRVYLFSSEFLLFFTLLPISSASNLRCSWEWRCWGQHQRYFWIPDKLHFCQHWRSFFKSFSPFGLKLEHFLLPLQTHLWECSLS